MNFRFGVYPGCSFQQHGLSYSYNKKKKKFATTKPRQFAAKQTDRRRRLALTIFGGDAIVLFLMRY